MRSGKGCDLMKEKLGWDASWRIRAFALREDMYIHLTIDRYTYLYVAINEY